MTDRRRFLRSAAGTAAAAGTLGLLPPAIRKARAIPANHRAGSLHDVEHIVVLMQENRAFDHYFGAMRGVRGFADRFPVPVADAPGLAGKTVWYQRDESQPGAPATLAPFHLDTGRVFELMRVTGTPHTWSNTQDAWGEGCMQHWPTFKNGHAMGYFDQADVPFQYALADAFTVADAYHASFLGGTNTNRCFLWSGTNDPLGKGNGPAIGNTYNKLGGGKPDGGYAWTTYPERLEAAGVSWQIYQDMANNFALNATAGFKRYRDAFRGAPGAQATLKDKALSTRSLGLLRQDVLDGRLPQVSWICPTRQGSEHPGPSSPAQGAAYVSAVLDALTADPAVWSKTVLLLMFDENDGFFDHVPPPAVPSYLSWHADPAQAVLAGASTVDTLGEYHGLITGVEADDHPRYLQRPYGLGMRVPMVAISPWSKGGWVNSEVFDHTSVIRFIEARFGVHEPNITPWRRAVCGDLTSLFDFATPNHASVVASLPATATLAARAGALPGTRTPAIPALPELPSQASGTRPSRALPYVLHAQALADAGHAAVHLSFTSSGQAGVVFHVYDRLHLDRVPRRYTVEAGKRLAGTWDTRADAGRYDLWVLGPNGWHRHFIGPAGGASTSTGLAPEIEIGYDIPARSLRIGLRNDADQPCTFVLAANAYVDGTASKVTVPARARHTLAWPVDASGGWYDFTVTVAALPGYARRCAGRMEAGAPSVSDPAMGGRAIGEQWRPPGSSSQPA
ncbi:phosphocholine-specific phospholipase C [Cupriavidus sp. YAF13]|uniref:phosphocholine-specific phospholipase C n=1 Tax=Cupriavidus sp. YAF13 TaxID=3233075 RepID=UPI003F923E60